MAQKRHPLFFRLFSHFSGETQPGTLDSCMQKARLQLSTNRPGFVFNMMDVWSGGSLKPGVRLRSTRRNDFPSAPRANARVIDPRFRVRQETPPRTKTEDE